MTPYDLPGWIVLLWLFVLGATIGSFLNVCIYRIPQHERFLDQIRGLWSPPSRCPRCGTRILTRDNIPILGWLWLGGRCRKCRARISPRYPLIELFNGLLFVFVYWCEVPLDWGAKITESATWTPFAPFFDIGLSDVALLHWRYAYHMVLIEALVVATFIDFDLMIIPDGATLPAMAVGLLGGLLIPSVHLVPVWFEDPFVVNTFAGVLLPEWLAAWVISDLTYQLPEEAPAVVVPAWLAAHPHLHGLLVSVAGFIIGGGVVWTVRIIGHWVLRREAMGFGDVILMAMIGSFLGWQPTVVVFFIAPIAALAVVAISWLFRRDREIPYGPYLSLGALLMIVGWQHIWPATQRIFEMGLLVPLLGLFAAVMLAVCLQGMQLLKQALGIPLDFDDDEPPDDWTSADQLTYLAGENHDPHQGRWRTETWPGHSAGRGTAYEDQWRRGATNTLRQNGHPPR